MAGNPQNPIRRKRKASEFNSRVMLLSNIPVHVKENFKAACYHNGTSMNKELSRHMMQYYIENRKSMEDAAFKSDSKR